MHTVLQCLKNPKFRKLFSFQTLVWVVILLNSKYSKKRIESKSWSQYREWNHDCSVSSHPYFSLLHSLYLHTETWLPVIFFFDTITLCQRCNDDFNINSLIFPKGSIINTLSSFGVTLILGCPHTFCIISKM